MFRLRNRRNKSRKERNYAPPLANSWLCHCSQCMWKQLDGAVEVLRGKKYRAYTDDAQLIAQ